jgi:hypothetical protein
MEGTSILLCLFVGYLSTVSMAQALWRRMVLCLVDNGLGKSLEQSGFCLTNCFGIRLEEFGKTAKLID